MITCFICKNEIKNHNARHIYHCAKINHIDAPANDIKFEQLKFKHGLAITKEWFEQHYIQQEWSLPDFKKHYGLGHGDSLFLIQYFGFTARSISESKKTSRTKRKFESTCLDNYGVPNPSSSPDVKAKRAQTFLSRYGVDNIRKSKWFKEWHSNHMLTTYGKGSLPNRHGNMQKFWDTKTDDEKREHMLPANNGYKSWYASLSEEEKIEYNQRKVSALVRSGPTKPEITVAQALLELNIPFTWQFFVNQRSYDFRIATTNLLIEVNGDYWHANPKMYAPADIIKYPDKTITAQERWNQENEKTANAQKYGYTVLKIWESDINQHVNGLHDWIVEQIKNHRE